MHAAPCYSAGAPSGGSLNCLPAEMIALSRQCLLLAPAVGCKRSPLSLNPRKTASVLHQCRVYVEQLEVDATGTNDLTKGSLSGQLHGKHIYIHDSKSNVSAEELTQL